MADLIDNELFLAAKNDTNLINSVKNIIINRFLTKKIHHLLWHIFHSFSVLYPDFPDKIQQSEMKSFLLQIKSNLTLFCHSCNNIKDTFIEKTDLDIVVSSKNNLINFFREYHIFINTNLRFLNNNYDSSIFTNDFIIEKYIKNDFILLIETKYGINLYKLFLLNKLNLFFNKFNEIKQSIYKEKYNFKFDFYGL